MAESTSPKEALVKLESVLNEYLVKKAPALPKNVKDVLVAIAPWFTIIGILFAVPAILAIFGLGAMMSSLPGAYGQYGQYGFMYMVSIAFLVVSVVLQAMAVPGLLAKQRKGWEFVFYGTLVSAASNLVSMNIGGLVIGTLIGMYFLFQVREYYK